MVKDQEKQMVGQKRKNNGEGKQRVREEKIEENWMGVERKRGVEKKKIGTENEDNSTEKKRKVTVKKRKSMEQNRDKWDGKGG